MDNKTKQAMQMALEALEMQIHGAGSIIHSKMAWGVLNTALREALAEQAEQEPVDGLARACNLAGLDYKDFLRIKAYLPVSAPVDAKAIRAEALEEAAKVCDDKHDYMCSRAAAAIRSRCSHKSKE